MKLLFSRRPHRRALHVHSNLGGIDDVPYFHAVREAVDLDEDSDVEIDYRVGPNQFRVYRQKFGDNYDDILSESFYYTVLSRTFCVFNF